MGKKFVGLDGLKHFWTKAKTWITGQITAEVTAKIAELVANAPEDLDTLKEIADWIKTHANDASAMNTAILANTEAISGKADKSHTHTKSEITDFPTSLPAKAYQIFGQQAVGWVKLGTLTSNESESIVISVCTGEGFNGLAFQNSRFRIMIKNGNHASQSAIGAFGVTVERTEESYSIRVKVIAFANNVCDVWVYMPWTYYAGNYSITGLYLKWVHSGEYQSSEPSGTEQSLLYRTILNSEDTQTITGAKTFTNDITAPNITSLEQRVAALESKV